MIAGDKDGARPRGRSYPLAGEGGRVRRGSGRGVRGGNVLGRAACRVRAKEWHPAAPGVNSGEKRVVGERRRAVGTDALVVVQILAYAAMAAANGIQAVLALRRWRRKE